MTCHTLVEEDKNRAAAVGGVVIIGVPDQIKRGI